MYDPMGHDPSFDPVGCDPRFVVSGSESTTSIIARCCGRTETGGGYSLYCYGEAVGSGWEGCKPIAYCTGTRDTGVARNIVKVLTTRLTAS